VGSADERTTDRRGFVMDDLSVELNEFLTQMLDDEIEQIRAKLVHCLAGSDGIICDPTTNDFCSVTSKLSVFVSMTTADQTCPVCASAPKAVVANYGPGQPATELGAGARDAAIVDGGTAFATDFGRNVENPSCGLPSTPGLRPGLTRSRHKMTQVEPLYCAIGTH
jgi:hypothetical protein